MEIVARRSAEEMAVRGLQNLPSSCFTFYKMLLNVYKLYWLNRDSYDDLSHINLVLKTDKIIIVGDFNIHVDNTNDSCSVAFISILNSIGFSVSVYTNRLIVVTTHLTLYYHTVSK